MLRVLTLPITPFQQNARILFLEGSALSWVVDPGGEIPRLLDTLRAHSLEVDAVVLTHAHIDHGGGVRRLLAELAGRERAPVLVSCGEEERALRSSLSRQALLFGLSPKEYEDVPEPDVVVSDGDSVALDSTAARALFTPGHSPGHMAFYFEQTDVLIQWLDAGGGIAEEEQGKHPVLIAGDTLFSSSIGRTDLPGGDQALLLRSIKEKLYTLPGDTRVLAGHGPDTTIERERTTNPFVRG